MSHIMPSKNKNGFQMYYFPFYMRLFILYKSQVITYKLKNKVDMDANQATKPGYMRCVVMIHTEYVQHTLTTKKKKNLQSFSITVLKKSTIEKAKAFSKMSMVFWNSIF
jgi:hypothetical protein